MVGGLAAHQTQQFIPHSKSAPTSHVAQEKPKELQLQCFPSPHHVKTMEEFRKVHAQYIKLGLDRIPRHAGDLLVACSLSEWGSMDYARSIFLELDHPGTFDFNAMIRGTLVHADPEGSLLFYRDMLERSVKPDNFTFPSVLKACSRLSVISEGTQIHGHVFKLGFESDVFAQNSLINMYGKCGRVGDASAVFEQMPSASRTVASWSALLAAQTRTGLWGECLGLFATMNEEGVKADESSMVSALSSCKNMGAFDMGRSIHCSLLRRFTALNIAVRTSLIDMYINCGSLEKGIAIFETMSMRNAWTYSAVISGLAMHGEGERALQVFRDMLGAGHEPDEAIYVGVLSACSRAGLLEEGLRCFNRMKLEHRIPPNPQHYGCMVDLMARAGKLKEAHELIQSMPREQSQVAWRCLLSACKIHEDLELAERAVENLSKLGAQNSGDYIILSNLYAKAKRWNDAAKTRTKMVDRGLLQVPGYSKVEVKGKMHTFVSHDKSHPESHEIYEMLHQMEWQLRFEGYSPDTSEVLLDVDEEEKKRALGAHSQKLAIAYALIASAGDRTPIRIVSNLRMSKNCHTYTALISRIFEREIRIRDRNRYHRFRQGECSCGDHW